MNGLKAQDGARPAQARRQIITISSLLLGTRRLRSGGCGQFHHSVVVLTIEKERNP
jgi:hypothetical protein